MNDRLLVFGGYGEGVYHNDLWEFSEANGWRELERTRTLGNPVPRSGHSAVWDAQANAMLLFGGVGPTGMRNDLVQYGSGGSWLGLSGQAVPGAPTARRAQAVAWDSRVNRILVFGGILDVEKAANDFWGFRRGIGWTQLTEDGAITSPSRRDQAAMDWDGSGLRLLLFGGRGEQNRELNDLWEFGPSSIWQQLVAADHSSAPPARASHTASWDTEAGRLLVYGGAAGEETLGDLWQYSRTGGWKRLHETGAPGTPDARFGHATAFDPKGKRLLVYGGCTDLECPTNEVWQYAPLRR